MKRIQTEIGVGIFVIIVFAVLAFMTFKVADIQWGKKEGYRVHAYFKNLSGLDKKTKLKVAGVDAGVIENIELIDGRARLTLRIYPSVKLYSDAEASIRASGLLGDKYLHIQTGEKSPLLNDGDTIENIREVVDIDDLIATFSTVSENINKLLTQVTNVVEDDEVKNDIKETVKNLRDLTADLKETVGDNKEKFTSVINRVDSLVASLDDLIKATEKPLTNTVTNLGEFTQTLKTDGPELVGNLNKAMENLKEMLEENRPAMKSIADRAETAMGSISNITGQIERGEGTIGKLLKDERLYASLSNAVEGVDKTLSAVTRFRTFLTFQGEYLFGEKDGKGYFYVTLQPRKDKYYILGINSDPLGNMEITETTTNGVISREEKREAKLELTAQIVKRFGNSALRIGITENTFGLGADYFLLNDKVKFSVDAWDFSEDEYQAENPHVKAGADYFVFKHIFISGGVNNIFNKKQRAVYAGAGIKFEDEDFKYLFGSMPKIPGQ
ncbi:MAG: MlaD family protein [Thermodesulfovibrionales bacterium]|nr:MlaD family protein [Thermodesulfovibrionales bacterium]